MGGLAQKKEIYSISKFLYSTKRRTMTDKILFQQIRKLVKEQKERTQLDTHRQDFAQEYCRLQMLKKKQIRHRQQAKINNIFKNFENVESYINIMDIINNLPITFDDQTEDKVEEKPKDELPEIIPKSLQMKMKEKLGPILDQKYQEENKKRQNLIEAFKEQIDYGNSMNYESSSILKQIRNMAQTQRGKDRMEQIDILRKDIKRKEVYFIERKFDDQMKEISKVPTKIENTKIFHKICSYLHMILEQEHKQKWASREDKKLREARRLNSKKYIRVSGIQSPNFPQNNLFNKSTHSRFMSTVKSNGQDLKTSDNGACESESIKSLKKEDSLHRQFPSTVNDKVKKLQTTKQLLKENFTFRKRNIKAGLMVKINEFVDTLSGEEKKNVELSKKYGKALQSLSEEIKTSYSRFERQEIAQEEDIEDMKRYLDNTLSRNKKDLKKFHHK